MPNVETTWSTISACCPVKTTRCSEPPRASSARTTGAIFTASGRVPITDRILGGGIGRRPS